MLERQALVIDPFGLDFIILSESAGKSVGKQNSPEWVPPNEFLGLMQKKSTKPAKEVKRKNSEKDKTEKSENITKEQTGGVFSSRTEKGGTTH